ncbi:hypothetical protein GBA52_016810 [Prunus armeniaca]|nr:hypothetical protein GBA52_016810 [Prunus armeniaca]
MVGILNPRTMIVASSVNLRIFGKIIVWNGKRSPVHVPKPHGYHTFWLNLVSNSNSKSIFTVTISAQLTWRPILFFTHAPDISSSIITSSVKRWPWAATGFATFHPLIKWLTFSPNPLPNRTTTMFSRPKGFIRLKGSVKRLTAMS